MKDEVPSCRKNIKRPIARLSTIFIMDNKFYREDTGLGLYGKNSENMISSRHICCQNNRTFVLRFSDFPGHTVGIAQM